MSSAKVVYALNVIGAVISSVTLDNHMRFSKKLCYQRRIFQVHVTVREYMRILMYLDKQALIPRMDLILIQSSTITRPFLGKSFFHFPPLSDFLLTSSVGRNVVPHVHP